MFYVNQDVKNLNRIFDQNLREGYLRMDLNENPVGLPKEFIDKVLSDVDSEFVAKYPETEPFQRFLADYIGVTRDEICLTNGSAEAIRHIFECYSRPGGKIVSVAPSYAMYEVFAKMYGRIHVPVAYKDEFKVDIEDILAAIDDDVDIVVVLNPNNPVGDVHSEEDVQRIIDKAKLHEATVLIDEAYYYFYPKTFVHFALENDHVFLTRTFSKVFSLAGCRLGYLVGKKEGVQLVQKLCTPHNVNAFSMKFAQTIMSTPGMVEQLVNIQLEGREHLINTLKAKGYNVAESKGNFVFIETKTDAGEVARKLKENKILVKYYPNSKYSKFIRVSIGEKKVIDQFLEVFYKVDQ